MDTNDEDEHQDGQMAFVVLLADFKVLFDKRQTPTIKKEKELAAKELALIYSRNMNRDINTKQVLHQQEPVYVIQRYNPQYRLLQRKKNLLMKTNLPNFATIAYNNYSDSA
ncbi:hypothetical protein CBL_12813 [Carabus blaptoides fortunei]